MSPVVSSRLRSVLLGASALAFASLLLTGCPKRPTPGAGTDTGPGSVRGTTGAPAGPPGGAPGLGQTATGAGPGGAGATAAGATTGTTLPALPSPTKFVESSALRDIQFDFDKYEIRPRDRAIPGTNARWLKANPKALVLVEGHCDERGTNEYNLALGQRRAQAFRDYLVATGVAGTRITIQSYGKERPLCTERTEGCWTRNRRAHFLVKW